MVLKIVAEAKEGGGEEMNDDKWCERCWAARANDEEVCYVCGHKLKKMKVKMYGELMDENSDERIEADGAQPEIQDTGDLEHLLREIIERLERIEAKEIIERLERIERIERRRDETCRCRGQRYEK